MKEAPENSEEEIAGALRQLTADYHQGRLSMPAYRRLRHTLLDRVDKGQGIMPLRSDLATARARPGVVVWIAIAAIVALLALVGWLLR